MAECVECGATGLVRYFSPDMDIEPVPLCFPCKVRSMLRKRWVVVRCWAGRASVMEPEPTAWQFWSRRSAQRLADRMSLGTVDGRWFEVHPVRIAHLDGR